MTERLAPWYALTILPLVALLSLVTTTTQADGSHGLYPRFLWIAAVVVIAGAVVVLPTTAVRERRPALWLALGSFTALLGYAFVRSLGVSRVMSVPATAAQDVVVPWPYIGVPLLEAFLAMAAGVLLAVAVPRAWSRRHAYALALLIALLSLVGFVRAQLDADPSARLFSGLGGAAVIHVPLLLVTATFLGLAWERVRTTLSLALALLSAGLVVATGSRAGLICLVVLVGLLATRYFPARGAAPAVSRRLMGIAVAAVAAIGVVLALVLRNQMLRLVTLSDPLREQNAVTALDAATSSPLHLLLGVGQGGLWPWFATEAGLLPVGKDGFLATSYGLALTNPHSLYLGTLAELGVVGCLLLLGLVGVVVRSAVTAHPANPLRLCLLTALGVSLLAFGLDYYLLKSFPLALLWWFFLTYALRVSPPRQ